MTIEFWSVNAVASLHGQAQKALDRERRSMSVSKVAANAKKKEIDEAKETWDNFG